ncbi:MAG: phosphate ABC transporter substrate-binding protein PstS [Pirellulales bacterium]|nr:phosphate ABC transporter substrate-binding protein PstS [Pirellulales bacterium]
MVSAGFGQNNGPIAYPMMSKWSSEYDKSKSVKVNYQSVGSGGGIQQMTVKTFDFGCTDAPLNNEQLQKARATGGEVLHIPLTMGAIVPAYNLDEVQAPLRFTGPVLADIFLGKITKWDEKPIRDLNPDATLPNKDIAVVRRSDGSGSTFIWTDYLAKVSPACKTQVGIGTSVNWPTGVGQKGNEGVAGQVKRTSGSIGYIELTYALQNKINYGLVRNKEAEFVHANLESVTAAANGALAEIPDDLRYSLTDQPSSGAYPISGTVWAVLYTNQPAEGGRAVVDFLRWVTHEGQQYSAELHFARLPQGLVERVEKKLNQVQFGR